MSASTLPDITWFETHSRRTLERLLPRLTQRFQTQVAVKEWLTFTQRLETHFPR